MGRAELLLGWMAVWAVCGLSGCGAKDPAALPETADASAGPDAAPLPPPDAAPMPPPDAAPMPPPDAAPMPPPDAAQTPPPDAAPMPPPDAAAMAPPDAAPIPSPDAAPLPPPDAAPMAPPDAAPMAPPDAAPMAPPDAAPMPSPDATPMAPPDAAPMPPPDATPMAPPDAALMPSPDAAPMAPPDAASMLQRPSPPDVANDPAGVQCLEVADMSAESWSPVEPECTLPVPMEGSAGEIVDPDTGEVVVAWGATLRVGADGRPYAVEEWRRIRNSINNWSSIALVSYCRHDAAGRVDLMGDVVEERCEFALCDLNESGDMTLYVRDAEGRIIRIVDRDLTNEGEEFVAEYFWDDAGRLVFALRRTCSPRRVLSAEEVGPCDDVWFARLKWGADSEVLMVESGGSAPFGPMTGIRRREVRPGGCPAP